MTTNELHEMMGEAFSERERAIAEYQKSVYKNRHQYVGRFVKKELNAIEEHYGSILEIDVLEELLTSVLDGHLRSSSEMSGSIEEGYFQKTISFSMPEYSLVAYVSNGESWILRLEVDECSVTVYIDRDRLKEVVYVVPDDIRGQVLWRASNE